MKRGKFSFVGLLVSVALALAPITYAPLDASGASSGLDDIGSINSADSGVLYRVLAGFVFAGQPVYWQRVMNIAKDPVISWGTLLDDYGNVQQGELWLIVAKNDKFIYFHLTDTPNSASNTTAYGGYTVKIKATMTNELYGFGGGGTVPVIGNDTDAFLSTTTEMMVNSAFIEGEPQTRNISTGAVIEYLVHLYDVEQSYSMPRVGSTYRTAIQYFAPDGTELTEPFSQSTNVSASSGASYSAYCTGLGDTYTNSANTAISAGQAVFPILDTFVAFGVGTHSSGVTLGAALPAMPGITVLLDDVQNFHIAILNLAKNVGIPIGAAMVEGLCESLTTPDVLPVIELTFKSPDINENIRWEIVCVDLVHAGESRTTWASDGEGTVTRYDQDTCLEWDAELQLG